MTARLRPLILLGVTAAAGCSLICTFDGLQQPCDSAGDCLAGYSCVQGLCVGDGGVGSTGGGTSSGGSSGGGGCSSDSACLAGACVSGSCSSAPTAWSDGGRSQSAVLDSCYPWPPLPSAGNAPVELTGCVEAFLGDTLPGDGGLGDGGVSVEVLEDGIPIVAPTPAVASSACASGLGYRVSVPPGQLLDVVVDGPSGWTVGHNQAVEIPVTASGTSVRNIGTLSVAGWTQRLGAVAMALKLPEKGNDALEVGGVRDCNGLPLSGVSIESTQPDGGGLAVVYLDATGTPVASRTATDSSGLFAAVALPGNYTLTFLVSTSAGSQSLATLPVVVAAGGTGWIDLAPQGP